ncbi:MAG: hypothetical protein ABSD29_00710 [Verrucomicrobiota bacterium]|jgi:hypothetical protein
MKMPQPETFEIVFSKREELLQLDPEQVLESAEIIAACEEVREVTDVFEHPEEETCFTYTRG